MKLIRLIHDTFKSFKKEDELMRENKALQVAFQQGAMVCFLLNYWMMKYVVTHIFDHDCFEWFW